MKLSSIAPHLSARVEFDSVTVTCSSTPLLLPALDNLKYREYIVKLPPFLPVSAQISIFHCNCFTLMIEVKHISVNQPSIALTVL